jgi:transposase-like protein
LKTGTILEDSPIPLEKWLPAVWMPLNCKNGMSSSELHRALGVTQKTAWFMLHRIRFAAQSKTFSKKLGAEVEVHETFIGGKPRNMHASERKAHIHGGGPGGKAIVAAVLKRGGTVRAKVCSTRRKPELQELLRENVEVGSRLYSDAPKSYDGLDEFQHQLIDHAVAYLEGNLHTTGLETFWSLQKRSLIGTYVNVDPFHLFRYVAEQAFRFNNRNMDNLERFVCAMRHIVGRTLTYKELTGKAEAAHGA